MTEPKPTLYLETSVVSYLTSRLSRDLVAAARQEITRRWWEQDVDKYDVFVSEVVIEEAGQGDDDTARKRLDILSRFPLLPSGDSVRRTAKLYAQNGVTPPSNPGDAAHLAFAAIGGIDFLVSWNFKHLVNAFVRRRLRDVNVRQGLHTPTICTPEELLGE